MRIRGEMRLEQTADVPAKPPGRGAAPGGSAGGPRPARQPRSPVRPAYRVIESGKSTRPIGRMRESTPDPWAWHRRVRPANQKPVWPGEECILADLISGY